MLLVWKDVGAVEASLVSGVAVGEAFLVCGAAVEEAFLVCGAAGDGRIDAGVASQVFVTVAAVESVTLDWLTVAVEEILPVWRVVVGLDLSLEGTVASVDQMAKRKYYEADEVRVKVAESAVEQMALETGFQPKQRKVT